MAVLDTTFGLLYYFSDKLGYWRPGSSWVRENRILFLLCFLVFPILMSFIYSTFAALSVKRISERNYNMALIYVVILLVIFFAIQTSVDGRISYGIYYASNF